MRWRDVLAAAAVIGALVGGASLLWLGSRGPTPVSEHFLFAAPLSAGESREALLVFELPRAARHPELWLTRESGLAERFPRLARSLLADNAVWKLTD